MRAAFVFIFAALAMCGNSSTTEAKAVDGFRLAEMCAQSALNAQCESYVLGVVDVYASMTKSPRLCLPHDLDRAELVDAVRKYVRSHPEEGQYSAHSIVLRAVDEKFPCRAPKKK